jgi:hypothetical protein
MAGCSPPAPWGRSSGARGDAGWLVGVPDRTAAVAVLTREGWTVREEGALLRVDGAGDGADITRCLAGEGLWVNELPPVRADLESVFLELIGAHASASAPPAPEHRLTLTRRDPRSER